MNSYIDTNELERNGFYGRARAEYLRRAANLPDGPTKKLCLKRADECLAAATKLAATLIDLSEKNARATAA